MKKYIFVFFAIFLTLLSSCSNTPEAYKSARFYFGLRVDRKIEPVLYEEYWSLKGEGVVNIIYEFDSISNAAFLKRNKLSDFKNLPLKEKPPIFAPSEFNKYIPSELYHQFYVSNSHDFLNHAGKYKITCKKGKLSSSIVTSSIVIYDEDLMKLMMNYTVDQNGNP